MRRPAITIYIEKINGLSLEKAEWERNTLPEPSDFPGFEVSIEQAFETFRRRFGGYVIIQAAIAKMTANDYKVFLEKFNAINNAHPDPSYENIYLTSDESGNLDVVFGDWEHAGSIQSGLDAISKLRKAHKNQFFEP